jgi:hypothetical protein
MKNPFLRTGLAVVAATTMLLATPIGPASAATTNHFLLENVASGQCVTETGSDSGMWMATCPDASSTTINHSYLWDQDDNIYGQIYNMHSGLCIIVTGATDGSGAWLSGPANDCAPVTVDEWSQGSEGPAFQFQNDHSGLCLADVSGALEQISCLDGGTWWYETPTNSAD